MNGDEGLAVVLGARDGAAGPVRVVNGDGRPALFLGARDGTAGSVWIVDCDESTALLCHLLLADDLAILGARDRVGVCPFFRANAGRAAVSIGG